LKRLRNLVEYFFTLLMGVFVRALNVRQAHALAAWLGRLGFRLGVARSVTMENLKRAFPEKTPAEIKKIALGSYENFVIIMVEILRMPLIDPRELLVDFKFEGQENLEAGLRRGKGIVALSGHFGNWEGMSVSALAYGFPITVMVGNQSNPYVDRLFKSYREHCELGMVSLKDFRGVMSILRKNQILALLGDQDGDRWGMFVDFLGTPASTYIGPAVFARKAGSAMVFSAAVRMEPGKYVVKNVLLPDPPPGLDDEQDTYFRLKA
jgi:Kdo2-lipid IVA lauroyltransferase/acyltransferase